MNPSLGRNFEAMDPQRHLLDSAVDSLAPYPYVRGASKAMDFQRRGMTAPGEGARPC
jgi:hypothetical protein